jgi:deoxycytidine triphosphate deaminase
VRPKTGGPATTGRAFIMAILCDSQIRELIGIEPFEENTKRAGKVSFGVSSYGYDIRVGSVFKIFTNVNSEIVDPKNFSEKSFVTVDPQRNRIEINGREQANIDLKNQNRFQLYYLETGYSRSRSSRY